MSNKYAKFIKPVEKPHLTILIGFFNITDILRNKGTSLDKSRQVTVSVNRKGQMTGVSEGLSRL